MISDTLISTADLARHLGDPAFVIVDCRHNLADVDAGERAYRAAHIPGAVFLYLDRDLSGAKTGRNGRHPLPDVAALAATFGRTGIDNTRQVIAYDQNAGMWASRLWWLLRWLGHDAVAVLDGGLDKGTAQRRLQTRGLPRARAATLLPKRPGPAPPPDGILRHLNAPSLFVLHTPAP